MKYVELSSFPRPSKLDCAEVVLENCLRTCNVLASVCNDKKEAGGSEEVSQSKSVIAVTWRNGGSGTSPRPELSGISVVGVGEKLLSAFQNVGAVRKLAERNEEL